MDRFTIQIPSEEAVADAARSLARILGDTGAKVVAFHGEMGAGKTTLIRQLAGVLGADIDEANSPSFSILNEYDTPSGPIYHFDLYRLESPEEAFDIGIEDFLYSGHLCLLEWPERVEAILPPETSRVEITVNPDFTRTLTFTPAPQ